MKSHITSFLCLATTTASFTFQLVVVYPNQCKIHRELQNIRKILANTNQTTGK